MIFYIVMVIVLVAALKGAYWFAITRWLPGKIRASEIHHVTTGDGWTVRLFRYSPEKGEPGEPVFICHGFSVSHWNMAAPSGESLVDTLVARGYDCWLIDLRGNRTSIAAPGKSRNDATFEDYVLEDIPACLAFIREHTGYDQVHWIGHSMGGMLLYAHEVVHGGAAIASGTTIGAPPGFKGVSVSKQKTLLGFVRKYPGLAEVYVRALSPLIPLVKLRTRLLPVNWDNMHKGINARAFYDLAELPRPKVAEKLIDAATFGYLGLKDNTIDVFAKLTTLRTPMFVIHGVLDPLATVENVRAFFDGLPSADKRRLELSRANGHSADYDHIDLVFSKQGPSEVYEPIAEWLAAHAMDASHGKTTETDGAAEVAADEAEIGRAAAMPIVVHAQAGPRKSGDSGNGGGLWGTALKNAADILTGIEGDSHGNSPSRAPHRAPLAARSSNTPKARVSRRKAVTKKAAAKKATAQKPAARKSSPTSKVARRPKAKKKSAKKKVAAKRAPSKKSTVRKSAPKKRAVKKQAAKKKSTKAKTLKKKPSAKKPVKKKAAKKKTPARSKPKK